MPKGSDDSWARKLYKQHLGKAQHFAKPRMSDAAFIIRHYADDVIYDCDGFVIKNRDTINEEHLSLLRASEVCACFDSPVILFYLLGGPEKVSTFENSYYQEYSVDSNESNSTY